MNPDTGEIKEFEGKKPVPDNWIGLPSPDEEVEIVAPPSNKRGMKWKVVEIIPGTPGKMVVEPVIETVNRCRKHAERWGS
jgi:hypothetical protein